MLKGRNTYHYYGPGFLVYIWYRGASNKPQNCAGTFWVCAGFRLTAFFDSPEFGDSILIPSYVADSALGSTLMALIPSCGHGYGLPITGHCSYCVFAGLWCLGLVLVYGLGHWIPSWSSARGVMFRR